MPFQQTVRRNAHAYDRAYDSGQSPDILQPKYALFSQIKFGQTNLLYAINGNFIEFAKNNECPDNFRSLS